MYIYTNNNPIFHFKVLKVFFETYDSSYNQEMYILCTNSPLTEHMEFLGVLKKQHVEITGSFKTEVGLTGVIKNTEFPLVLVFIVEFPGINVFIISMGKVKNLKTPGFFQNKYGLSTAFPLFEFFLDQSHPPSQLCIHIYIRAYQISTSRYSSCSV